MSPVNSASTPDANALVKNTQWQIGMNFIRKNANVSYWVQVVPQDKTSPVKYLQCMEGKMEHVSMERVFGLPVSADNVRNFEAEIVKMLADFKAEDEGKKQGGK